MKMLFLAAVLLISTLLSAHIEPPKTLKEKKEREAGFAKKAAAGMRSTLICDRSADAKLLPVVQYYYDNSGRDSLILLHDKEGRLDAIVVQVYDQFGNLVLDADRSPEGLLKEMNVLEYDEDGLIWKIVSYDSAWQISGRLSYELMPETAEVFVTKTDKDNKPEYAISYHYADSPDFGNCFEIIQNDAAGALKLRVENEYGSDGRRTKKHIYGADDSLSYSFAYTYNSAGDFLEIIQTDADGQLMRTDTYTYDEKGFVSAFKAIKADGKVMADRLYQNVFK